MAGEQKETTIVWSNALGRYVSEAEIDQALARIPVLPCLELVVIEDDTGLDWSGGLSESDSDPDLTEFLKELMR